MHGGYRQGSGRKQGYAAKSAEEARKLLAERVAEEIGPIADILISKAKKGDIRAIKELFDRAWGRPPVSVDIDTNEGIFPVPIGGIKWSELSDETLSRYAFTPEELEILEKRLLPNN